MTTMAQLLLREIPEVETVRRRDRVAKRARDEEGLPLREEDDACGWSSAVLERGLALRRRRGPAPCSPRGSGWAVATPAAAAVAAAADEHDCGGEHFPASDALAQKAAVKRNLGYIYFNAIYY